jgi:hypothetical protein
VGVGAVTGAAALAVLAVAGASPASSSDSHRSTATTTTTTAPQTGAVAKLVIKSNSLGHVSVRPAGASALSPGRNAQDLHVGDTVQTDASGRAEIDYSTSAWTRLDFNAMFTVKKLTDSQGHRQVEGGLASGRTWNRTVALSQSESFQQDGAGATAAVYGTGFVTACPSADHCTFTAVFDNVTLTGANGQTRTLQPLDQCDSMSSALCAFLARLTPDQIDLIQWIQYNVFLDLADHDLGLGVFQPFTGAGVGTSGLVTGAGVGTSAAGSSGGSTSSYSGCSPSVSNLTLVLGQTATVATAGNCWLPNTSVVVTIESTPIVVATGSAAADGSFATAFVVPATLAVGQHTLTLTGTNLLGHSQVLSVAITVVASASQARSSGGGGLAFTGRDSGTLLGIAAALMALGASLTISARRRREARATL